MSRHNMTWAPLSIKNLTNALSGVVDCEGLGIQLEVDYCELQKIFKDLPTTEERKRAVVNLWLESNTGACIEISQSWQTLLVGIAWTHNESCYSVLQCIIDFLGLFFRSELLIAAVEISSVD